MAIKNEKSAMIDMTAESVATNETMITIVIVSAGIDRRSHHTLQARAIEVKPDAMIAESDEAAVRVAADIIAIGIETIGMDGDIVHVAEVVHRTVATVDMEQIIPKADAGTEPGHDLESTKVAVVPNHRPNVLTVQIATNDSHKNRIPPSFTDRSHWLFQQAEAVLTQRLILINSRALRRRANEATESIQNLPITIPIPLMTATIWII